MATEYICPKYSNIFDYQNICLGLSLTDLAIHIFCVFLTQIELFWTIINYLKPFLMNNENSNLFAIIDIGQMHIQIFSK